jgi:adenylosuccinate synthase
MPVSIVVGGQFGSEGKGKTALEIARKKEASIVVRVGGTNSGHTALDRSGKVWALRQLPVSVLAPSTTAVLPAGAIIDPTIFRREVHELGLSPSQVVVSPYATLITDSDKERERTAGLIDRIGSTGSGTGAALARRISRQLEVCLAKGHPDLQEYLGDTGRLMRAALDDGRWIVIEGSQGFGLSVLHGGYYPKATSRDTTAATFLGEAGLGPLEVREVTLVLRAHPIRVAGDSGELKGETTWSEIAKFAGLPPDYCERTTATKKIRRVGMFDPELVQRAINANSPTRIVLNHFDYVDAGVRDHIFTTRALEFLKQVECSIGCTVDWVGTGPARFIDRQELRSNIIADYETSKCQFPPERNSLSTLSR